MKYIDVFNHFMPEKLWQKLLQLDQEGQDIAGRMRSIPAMYDLDTRLRIIEQFAQYNYTQVISLGMPPLEAMGPPEVTEDLAKAANEGMAELVQKYPHHFTGFLAALPMNSPQAAQEAERAFKDLGANGVQIHTNVNGRPLDDPAFRPIFEMAEKYDRPIFLHPSRTAKMADYPTEEKSKYEIWWTFGWPYETSAAMARLVFSGIMDQFPNLKVVAHHMGAMVPFFEGRVGPGMDQLGSRTTDEDLTLVLKRLKRRPLEYFKDFYADTATFGSRGAMICGLEFYSVDKVVFASDCPFDPEKGPGYIRDTIAIIEQLDITQEEREKIAFRNAQKLLGLN